MFGKPIASCKPFLFLLSICFISSVSASSEGASNPISTGQALEPAIKEGNGSLVECFTEHELEGSLTNWGENVNFTPKYVFIPKTKEGICNIVQWATEKKLKLRVSGYRHTWNPVYPDNGQILISLLGLHHVDSNKSPTSMDGNTGAGMEMKEIRFVPGANEPDKILCKVGGAVTNDELRAFCLQTKDPFKNSYWTIPLNVILVENTISGTISSICHGSGWQNRTLSDLVEEIEFVNAKGNLQTISKASRPDLMQAAAGNFGLLGIITSVTLKLDKLSYAVAHPKLVKLSHAIPPPPGTRLEEMPKRLQCDLKIHDQKSLDSIIAQNTGEFFARCEDDYSEWFWFILNKNCWINCWNKDDPANDDKNSYHWMSEGGLAYSHLKSWLQSTVSSLVEMFDNKKYKMPSPPHQEQFVKCANSMVTGLMSTSRHVLPLPEALHFQHGIRHIRVRDIELEIPIPDNEEGQPDWTVCQKAWWDAIYVVYQNLEETGTLPVNFTLEMRIMGGSDVTMAAQKGNKYTCSIEVLSNMLVPHEEWKVLAEQVIARWLSYKDREGKPLAVRTHWAKEWHGLQFNGVDAKTFVKNSYSNAIPKFRSQLGEIAAIGGYTLADMQERFSNQLWDSIVFDD